LFPHAGVIEGSDGALYGTTTEGPSENFSGGWGTIFRWHDGSLTTLHQFDYETGAHPTDLLVKGDGAVFGFTREGGPHRKAPSFA
jgi:uncharacterized repeat protein (TIGR03803 family)